MPSVPVSDEDRPRSLVQDSEASEDPDPAVGTPASGFGALPPSGETLAPIKDSSSSLRSVRRKTKVVAPNPLLIQKDRARPPQGQNYFMD